MAVVFFAAALAVIAGWTGFASRIDNYAYDFLFTMTPSRAIAPQSVVLAIDEATLRQYGGMGQVRNILADALDELVRVKPKAVAIDIVLADAGDPRQNARLAAAMSRTPNLILPCERINSRWEDPIPEFRKFAVGLGHIHADDQARDGVSRQIPLEMIAPGDRRWALSLVAFQFARGNPPILESPDDLEVAGVRIPVSRRTGDRLMRIRFPEITEPISVLKLKSNPQLGEALRGKTVFVGHTALTAARDRVINPRGEALPGVEVHRDAFETLAQGRFITSASNTTVLLVCVAIAIAAAVTFWFSAGWWSYLIAVGLLVAGHLVPVWFFRSGVVFPYFASVSAAWLSVSFAFAYEFFIVRRQLRRSEYDRARYRQAIHFVTHEMRTPLTAIQGSSELMGRYALSEDKRKQIAQMINSESKRLARMIQTFLDVERLSEGKVELKREPFSVRDIVITCLERVRPVADRKQMKMICGDLTDDVLIGDRELMEYAVYNLLTNAVKYSPAETEVCISAGRTGPDVRVSVRDQGMGLDEKEIRNIFQKFYRTKKAEASGEAGTGIGLSIVEQIVTEHGGRMEVASKPRRGSTFTMILPVHSEAPAGVVSASKTV